MKRGGGKRKGNEFERNVSRLLDTWWNVPDGTFWRSVNSGAWKEAADIAPRSANVEFPFVVECKFYKNLNMLDLFKTNSKTHPFRVWWKKLLEDVQKARQKTSEIRIGIIIFKYNNSPILVLFEGHIGEVTPETNGLPMPIRPRYDMQMVQGYFGKENEFTTLIVMKFTDFCNYYSAPILKKMIPNTNGAMSNESNNHKDG